MKNYIITFKIHEQFDVKAKDKEEAYLIATKQIEDMLEEEALQYYSSSLEIAINE